jgi:ABC-type sugar transport system substrate-binding protein
MVVARLRWSRVVGPSGRRSALLALLLAVLAVALVGCGGDDDGDSAATPTDPAGETGDEGSSESVEGKRVFLVTCEPNVFCHAYNERLKEKLGEEGVNVTQLSDNFEPAVQNQHMNQAIAARPDAIILFASNADAVVPALRRAQNADVPVINVNAVLNEEGEELIEFGVVADNKALGRFAAENLVEGMEKAGYDEGRVMVITGTMGTRIVQDRIDEFTAYMEDYPQYEVLPLQDGNWDQVRSSQLALQMFSRYRGEGGVQGAYGMADYMAAGIIQAAEQLGIPVGVDQEGGVVVTGSNCTPTGIPLMDQGKLWGNATQSPIEEADVTAQHVFEFLRGEEQEHTIVVEEERFTQETLDDRLRSLCTDWPS